MILTMLEHVYNVPEYADNVLKHSRARSISNSKYIL